MIRMILSRSRHGKIRAQSVISPILIVVAIMCLFSLSPLPSIPFAPPVHSSAPIAIVESMDPQFAEIYKTQMRSVQCYAQTHGYEYVFLDLRDEMAPPLCVNLSSDFHFRKHCAVAQWLRTRPAGSIAVVLDADVVAGTSNFSLDKWLQYDYDIAFYERSWNFEVASGNYIVRNTKFSRMFLHHWVNYEKIMPPGFSSTDNGAIHLAILEALGIKGRQRCKDLYRNLEALVTDLKPYFEFVACTKALLGPPRMYVAWHSAHDDLMEPSTGVRMNEMGAETEVAGKILIFPRFFGFVVDAMVYGFMGARNLHPFHHGLKKEEWKDMYLDSGVRGQKGCRRFTENGTISHEEMGKRLKQSDESVMECREPEYAQVPRRRQTDENCYAQLWCEPMAERSKEWPSGVVARGGKLVNLSFEEPEVDSYNEFTARMREGME